MPIKSSKRVFDHLKIPHVKKQFDFDMDVIFRKKKLRLKLNIITTLPVGN